MSAKAVTEKEGTAREAVLRAIMQEAAECVSGGKGAPKGPNGTQARDCDRSPCSGRRSAAERGEPVIR